MVPCVPPGRLHHHGSIVPAACAAIAQPWAFKRPMGVGGAHSNSQRHPQSGPQLGIVMDWQCGCLCHGPLVFSNCDLPWYCQLAIGWHGGGCCQHFHRYVFDNRNAIWWT